ncbi:hypothetical protein BC834DRAFT_1043731 [Gloeopeniophorella convolvens]|nr:hypothetical protein BC834DRAFT_1043731 [Gloeopeniophorella convolvens]
MAESVAPIASRIAMAGDEARDYPSRINVHSLPENALLAIFGFYRLNRMLYGGSVAWYKSVPAHVCRRWRIIIIAFPKYLDLQLDLRPRSRVAEILRDSPPFPIRILFWLQTDEWTPAYVDNAFTSLEQLDRATCIRLCAPSAILEGLLTVISRQAPDLETLHIGCPTPEDPYNTEETIPSSPFPISDSVRLHDLYFLNAFPLAVPSAGVVHFFLSLPGWDGLPAAWPDTLFECLRSMPQLEYLTLNLDLHDPFDTLELQRFNGPRMSLDRLFRLMFSGTTPSLEALLSRFDAPSLGEFLVDLKSHVDNTVNALPSLARFVDGSRAFETTTAHVGLSYSFIYLNTCPSLPGRGTILFRIHIPYDTFTELTVTLLHNALLPVLSGVKTLNVGFDEDNWAPDWTTIKPAELAQWCTALAGFNAVTTLNIDSKFVDSVVEALTEQSHIMLLPDVCEITVLFKGEDSAPRPHHVIRSVERVSVARGDADVGRYVHWTGVILDDDDWCCRHHDDNYLYRDERSRPPDRRGFD